MCSDFVYRLDSCGRLLGVGPHSERTEGGWCRLCVSDQGVSSGNRFVGGECWGIGNDNGREGSTYGTAPT